VPLPPALAGREDQAAAPRPTSQQDAEVEEGVVDEQALVRQARALLDAARQGEAHGPDDAVGDDPDAGGQGHALADETGGQVARRPGLGRPAPASGVDHEAADRDQAEDEGDAVLAGLELFDDLDALGVVLLLQRRLGGGVPVDRLAGRPEVT